MSLLSALLHETRYRGRWRALLAGLVAVTAWFAFVPGGIAPPATGLDKLDHLLAFAALAGAAALSLSAGWRQAATAAAGLVLYGGFIEVVQSFLPTRQADWADLLADTIGIGAGLLLVAWLRRAWRPQTA